MATVKVKVRALTKASLENDLVVIPNRENRMERFGFQVSPLGTADGVVIETSVDSVREADFKAAVIAKTGAVYQNNPAWADVKTDADDDGISDEDGTRYGWAKNAKLYEIVGGA